MKLQVFLATLILGISGYANADFQLMVNQNGLAPMAGVTSFQTGLGTPTVLDLFLVGFDGTATGGTNNNVQFQAGGASFGLSQTGAAVVSQAVTVGPLWTPAASGFGVGGSGSSGFAAGPNLQFTNSFPPLDPTPLVLSQSSAVGQFVKVGQFSVTPNQSQAITNYSWVDSFGGDNFFVQAPNSPGVNLIGGDAATTAVFTNSRAFTVAAVPEPSSLMLLGCIGAVATFKRRRRTS